MKIIFLLVLISMVSAETKCRMEQSWPPPPGRALPWYTINLDAPPEERWYEAVKPRAVQIKAMITEVIHTLTLGNPTVATILKDFVDLGADNVLSRFPPEYAAEIRGIYAATGIDVGLLCVYQIFYEVEGLCTSIVTQTPNGDIRHSRNLDFGLFLGWDKANTTWALTELLRPLLFNAKFIKNGQNIYNATYYAGYVGLLTGAKKGGFSITVDSRYDTNLDKYLLEWLTGKWQGLELGILTRTVMENNSTYDDALKSLSNIHIAGPAYIILGGAKTDEGAIITRNASGAVDVWTLAQQKAAGKYYVLETNYDHWKPAPFFDNRRTPAEKCLEIVGSENFSKETLYNVLTGKPNRNMLTTYTSLMHVPSGDFEAYLQYCPPPCDPW